MFTQTQLCHGDPNSVLNYQNGLFILNRLYMIPIKKMHCNKKCFMFFGYGATYRFGDKLFLGRFICGGGGFFQINITSQMNTATQLSPQILNSG